MSGPGEGAYASVTTDRSIGVVTVTNGGTAYSQDTEIWAYDPTGFPTYDEFGAVVPDVRTFGNGARLRPIFSTEYIAGYCEDPAHTDETSCTTALLTWTPEVTIGQLTAVNVLAGGSGFNDVSFIINDPTEAGAGIVLEADLNNVITEVNITQRAVSYTHLTLPTKA